jgi:hypothetical protein
MAQKRDAHGRFMKSFTSPKSLTYALSKKTRAKIKKIKKSMKKGSFLKPRF